jgi:gluconokinase
MKLRGEPPFVLALDVGTSSTRAQMYDARGRPVPRASVRAEHRLTTTPDGGATLDPDELLDGVRTCIEAARRNAEDAPLAALAMDCFWHSLLGIDGRGQPVTPVLTWADTRAAGAARDLLQQLDEPYIHARTGCRLHASYWPAKLLWLSRAEPEAFRRAKRWLSFAEYCQRQLTGELACSISMASATGLLNQRTCRWEPDVFAALPIEPEQLAPLVDLDHRLPDMWLPAIGDGAGSNAGSGCAGPNRLAVNIGTSSAMRLLLRSAAIEPPPGLWCYRLDCNRILTGGALSEGGNLWAWLRSQLHLPSVRATETKLAAMEPDGHGLTILPFIAGERSTGWHTEARLTIDGIRHTTRPIEVLRAAMEAVVYRLAAIYGQLSSLASDAGIVASGRAVVSSPTWLQIVADVLNRPVHALKDAEATARGTALVALEQVGVLSDFTVASFEFAGTYHPGPDRHARYLEAIARHEALYEERMR